MKTLYFECNMGAAGDMLMASLLELHDNPKSFLERLNGIGIPGVSVTAEQSVKQGINGTHIKVEINGQEENDGSEPHSHSHPHDHKHHHNSYHNIEHLINHLTISDAVKKNAIEVYRIIAEAESSVHGVTVNQVHFHEVGMMDAVADIIGVCMLIEELAPDMILASPINTGSGHVRCAHGILPVPAPATAFILQDVPIYNNKVVGELCTPTGAALLKFFTKRFCEMPVISVTRIGYGMGKKDFEKVNCMRTYMGNVDSPKDDVVELVCNLDDMTPEAVAFAQQLLFQEGALDVYTMPIGMKKGRAGISFTCMCGNDLKDKMVFLIFKHTTTLGIREYTSRRYILQKEHTEVETKLGTVKIKTSRGFGVVKTKPEYEDISRIALNTGKSIQEVLNKLDIEKN
ncbi:MAG: nickel pincer cofactor biosynthesis protein LarC [Lachnospiraceae bacterium]